MARSPLSFPTGLLVRSFRCGAIASHSREQADVESLKALAPHAIEEIEHFFVSYNQVRSKQFKPLGRHGRKRAEKLLEQGRRRRRRQQPGSKGASGKTATKATKGS
jgi:hypothetical protein